MSASIYMQVIVTSEGSFPKRRCGNDPLISLVVPFHNEEAAIPYFFAEIQGVIGALPYPVEIVCVDDGSSDRTRDMLQNLAATDKNIRVVAFTRNFGKEAAVSAGLSYAGGDVIIVIDADLQDPPSLIPQFIAKWREGFDVVYGIRSSRASDTRWKRWTANMFYRLFNAISDVPIPQGAGDFRLMDRKAVDALLVLPERSRFMKGLFSWIGMRQTGIEFVRTPRIAGKTKWRPLQLFNFAIEGFTSFTIAPLRIASLAGILVSAVGFLFAAFLIVRTLVRGVDVPGYASVMVAVLFIGGVQLVCLGLIGEYLGRLYMEAKQRPLYLVADDGEQRAVLSTGGLGSRQRP